MTMFSSTQKKNRVRQVVGSAPLKIFHTLMLNFSLCQNLDVLRTSTRLHSGQVSISSNHGTVGSPGQSPTHHGSHLGETWVVQVTNWSPLASLSSRRNARGRTPAVHMGRCSSDIVRSFFCIMSSNGKAAQRQPKQQLSDHPLRH